jgi:arylsulfatase A-like enzyme
LPSGIRVSQPVSLRDVPATILDLTGGTPAGALAGTSLVATWDSTRGANAPSAAVSQLIRSREGNPRFPNYRTALQSVVDEQYHYISSGSGKEELYAWRTDSLEQTDLAHSPEGSAIIRKLRGRLAETGRFPLSHSRFAGLADFFPGICQHTPWDQCRSLTARLAPSIWSWSSPGQ